MRHGVPEGNSSTSDTIALIRSGTLPPDEERRARNYVPRHSAVETHPLTDRPTEEIVLSVPGPIVSGAWDGPGA